MVIVEQLMERKLAREIKVFGGNPPQWEEDTITSLIVCYSVKS
jgi:hypothetical protein